MPCVRVASCLFPGSLAHYARGCSCFPESSLFGPGIVCFSLARPGSSLFQDRSGLYLSQATPVSLGGCPDLGQVRSAVRAFARRSGLFQGGSSFLSHRPQRFIQGCAMRSRRVLSISMQSGVIFRGMQLYPRVFVVRASHRLLFAWPPGAQFISRQVLFLFVAGHAGFSRSLR